MINPDFELQRLRQTLSIKGLDEGDVDHIVGLAREDIDTAVQDLVSNAVQSAAQAGMHMGAEEFVEQLEIRPAGGKFEITTSSGKTDFSLPPLPMLPHLLKNAKTAKDGSRYKIIPVGGKSSGHENRRGAANYSSLVDIEIEMSQQGQVERDQRKRQLDEARELTFTGQSTNMFSGLQKAQQFLKSKRLERKMEDSDTAQDSEPVQFRVASSKQNPAQDWVLPAVDRDMSKMLSDINQQLERDIHSVILDVVRRYEVLV
jgi:hypothetical protein